MAWDWESWGVRGQVKGDDGWEVGCLLSLSQPTTAALV